MDIYFNGEECEKKDIIFQDENKFKEYYNVVYNWDEIKTTILNTYSEPEIKYSPEIDPQYDPKQLFENLIRDKMVPYYKQTKVAVQNSIYYIFYKYKTAYYVRIRGGELNMFCYLYNERYNNPLYKHFEIEPKLKKFYKSNKKKWMDLSGMMRTFHKSYEGQGFQIDLYYNELKYFLLELVREKKIQDCDFIIMHKDRLSIKKDLTESSEELVGSINKPLQKQFKFEEYIPILSFNVLITYE